MLGQSLPSGLWEVQYCCTHHDLEKGHPPCPPASGSSWQNHWCWAKSENTGKGRTAHHCLWHNTDDVWLIKHTQKQDFELLTFVWCETKDKGLKEFVSHAEKEGRNSILKSTWKKGIKQQPRRQTAARCWCHKTCTISATCSYPGVSHWAGALLGTHPTVHTTTPLLNTSLAPQTTGTPLAAADKATKGSWVLVGRTLQGAGEPLNHLCPHIPFPFHTVVPHRHSCWLKLALTSEDSKAN